MDERNLAELFRDRSQRYAHLNRWRQHDNGTWRSANFQEHATQVYRLLAGLHALGARKGDRIGILAHTSVHWLMTDWAIWCLGGVTVTVYPSLLAETIAFIGENSQMTYLFVDDREQVDKLLAVRDQLSGIKRVIVYDPADLPDDAWFMSFDTLLQLDTTSADQQTELANTCAAAIAPDDLATIIYTSGTTGNPKGAMLSHACLLAEIASVRERLTGFQPGKVDLLFLPTAHIFGRLQHIAGVERGLNTTIVTDMKAVLADVQATQPEFFFSVPRIYEKIFSTAKARAEAKPITKYIFNWAIEVGRQVSHLRERGQEPTGMLKVQYQMADRLVFHKIRDLLGGNIQFAVTAGAPLDLEILEFFNGAGVLLLEAWGLTETTGALTVNSPEAYRLGTVGQALSGVEIKIAADGEILARGPMVMQGYYNSPDKTAEAIHDGWFYTGDIGELDADGFLRITDRKKDILVTAAGKNIAPQAVEAAFKNSPYISQCAVYGDRKPYLVALLTLDREALQLWAEREGVQLNDAPLHKHPKVRELIEHEAKSANAHLASFEQIKYYEILPEDFTIENGLLTPTLKLRRRYIYDQFGTMFEGLYHART